MSSATAAAWSSLVPAGKVTVTVVVSAVAPAATTTTSAVTSQVIPCRLRTAQSSVLEEVAMPVLLASSRVLNGMENETVITCVLVAVAPPPATVLRLVGLVGSGAQKFGLKGAV